MRLDRAPLTKGLASVRQELSQVGSQMMSIGARTVAMGSAIIGSLAAPIKMAADFEESISKFRFMFGDAADSAKAWGDEFAAQVGRSQAQIVEFMGNAQALLVPIGFEGDTATGMSKQLTELAVDLASFYNTTDADAMRDLQSALVGSSETMLKYGVIANEAAVKQELLNNSIDPTEATNLQKVQARYNIILRDTIAAQGDATRTSGSATNQFRALRASVSDLAINIGNAVLPVVSRLLKDVVGLIKPLGDLASRNAGVIASFAATGAAVAAAGAGLVGLGIAAKVSASAVSVVGVAYAAAASIASAAWTAVTAAFFVITIKARLSAAAAAIAWTVASTAVVAAWKTASSVLGTAISTAAIVASAALSASVWAATALAISASFLGVGATLSGVALGASAAWAAASAVVGVAWALVGTELTAVAAAAGLSWAGAATLVSGAWVAASGVVSAMAAAAMAAWVTGAGLSGAAIAALGAAFAAVGIAGTGAAGATGAAWSATGVITALLATKEVAQAAIVSAAWSVAGTVASLAWSSFTAVLSAALAPATLLAAAALVVKIAWAAAWATISGPILPFIAAVGTAVAIIGALAAAAGVAAAKGTSFRSSWEAIKGTLGAVAGAAQRTGNILISALKTGDYATAWRAAMAGIKLAIAEGLIGGQAMFAAFFKSVVQMLKNFVAQFTLSMAMLSQAAKKPWKAAEIGANVAMRLAAFDITAGIKFDPKKIKEDAESELSKLEKELAEREAQGKADEITGKAAADASQKQKDEIKDLEKKGKLTAEQAAAKLAEIEAQEKAAKSAEKIAEQNQDAYENEIKALRERITALAANEDAAERLRLKNQGLTDEQIADVMQLREVEKGLAQDKEAGQMQVNAVERAGDAMIEAGKSPADVMAEEQKRIKDLRKQGLIDEQTEKEALQEAELRAMQRDLDKGIDAERKRLGLDKKDAGMRQPTASIATTNLRALQTTSGPQDKQARLLDIANKKADKQIEKLDAVVAAVGKLGLFHA
jgi:hypothetical protein